MSLVASSFGKYESEMVEIRSESAREFTTFTKEFTSLLVGRVAFKVALHLHI